MRAQNAANYVNIICCLVYHKIKLPSVLLNRITEFFQFLSSIEVSRKITDDEIETKLVSHRQTDHQTNVHVKTKKHYWQVRHWQKLSTRPIGWQKCRWVRTKRARKNRYFVQTSRFWVLKKSKTIHHKKMWCFYFLIYLISQYLNIRNLIQNINRKHSLTYLSYLMLMHGRRRIGLKALVILM